MDPDADGVAERQGQCLCYAMTKLFELPAEITIRSP